MAPRTTAATASNQYWTLDVRMHLGDPQGPRAMKQCSRRLWAGCLADVARRRERAEGQRVHYRGRLSFRQTYPRCEEVRKERVDGFEVSRQRAAGSAGTPTALVRGDHPEGWIVRQRKSPAWFEEGWWG